jgi:Ca2+-binding EF-hand superfamily protein
MNKKNMLLISTLCTLAGSSVAFAHPGGKGGLERVDANKDGVVTSQEVEAEALAHFAAVDANKDGVLTAEERKAAHEQRRNEHFEERDANDNGVLERSEVERMPQEFFSKLDTDKSGSLSPAEMEAFGPGHGHRRGGHGPQGDQDRNASLTKADFLAKAKGRMAKLDTNQDGKITQDELKAGHGRGGSCDHEHGPRGAAPGQAAPKGK